jgi:hypothetical protein
VEHRGVRSRNVPMPWALGGGSHADRRRRVVFGEHGFRGSEHQTLSHALQWHKGLRRIQWPFHTPRGRMVDVNNLIADRRVPKSCASGRCQNPKTTPGGVHTRNKLPLAFVEALPETSGFGAIHRPTCSSCEYPAYLPGRTFLGRETKRLEFWWSGKALDGITCSLYR